MKTLVSRIDCKETALKGFGFFFIFFFFLKTSLKAVDDSSGRLDPRLHTA